ncbi:hypothetical protein AB0F91_36935 [Amycolatopsis sp. NPDC023774]|uniref:hypothetical protein n=1 Tax=Amycolatopsis sp. NPDC023774 TaxID=3155015 RepID=UPI0033F39A76
MSTKNPRDRTTGPEVNLVEDSAATLQALLPKLNANRTAPGARRSKGTYRLVGGRWSGRPPAILLSLCAYGRNPRT